MKRLLLIIPIFAAGIFLAGCNSLSQNNTDAQPTPTDTAANGEIEGMSTFTTPDPSSSPTAMSLQEGESTNKTIYQTAVDSGELTIFVSAVKAAGMEDILSGPGPFTVFIPSDAAFQKLPRETIASVLNNRNQIVPILSSHVVNGTYTSADLAEMASIETVQGNEAQITAQGSTLRIENATVITRDIQATNGVIHIIDTVIMPTQ